MQRSIDPKIDCVFKSLLGAEENRNLLIHFLNAFLAQELTQPLVGVDILNPYNDNEFINDQHSVVKVRARDSLEQIYQIEIRLGSYDHQPGRIIFNWADIFSRQLKGGKGSLLRPTYSIWLLTGNLIHDDSQTIHHYKMRDEMGHIVSNDGGIWMLELDKFHADQIDSEEQRWLKFFKDGGQLNDRDLPGWMRTPEMKQAMKTLATFSENERQYDHYRTRQEALREQLTIQRELEQAQQDLQLERLEKEAAKQREQVALHEKEAAYQREQEACLEIERLKLLLAQKEQ